MEVIRKGGRATGSSLHHHGVFLSMPESALYSASESFNLAELCAIVWERKLVVIAIVAFVTLATALATLGKPPRYSYVTSIEVGMRGKEGKFVPLESPEAVMAKIKESYIPLVLREATETGGSSMKQNDLSAAIPKNGQIVVLKSSGTYEEKALHVSLHNRVLQYVLADHKRTVDLIKKELDHSLIEASNALEHLKDEESLLRAQLSRLGEDVSLTLKEIRATEELISLAMENRERAIREAGNDLRAMALLMLADEIRRNRVRMTELERRAKIDLPNERDKLNKLLADKQRERIDMRSKIERIKLEMANVHETRAIAPTIQSINPIGIPKSIIMSLAVLLGLFVGVVAALFVHSIRKGQNVRAHVNERVMEEVELEVQDAKVGV